MVREELIMILRTFKYNSPTILKGQNFFSHLCWLLVYALEHVD